MAVKVEKTIQLSKFEIVKYQLIHHCFMNNLKIGDTALNCLALMGELGPTKLTEFVEIAAKRGILATPTVVHNSLYKLEPTKLFLKKKSKRMIVYLNPELNIQSEGTILINLKLIKREADTNKGPVQKNRAEAELA